ncbi:Semaphorin-3ab [Acipenser ruthenus]|uniref:Semaphorin-3ab n=1 Tax=Acipenser ruthenus TaxID=7906 RepID=A0A444U665_ACIRT|nr:Semaphorin-3ab [Acipenser ruthenus]
MDYLIGIVLLLSGVSLPASVHSQQGRSNVPRLKLSYKEMLDSNNLITFNGLANSSSYHTFLLDEEKGRLLVGAKDHIFSFNLIDINKDYQKKECSNFIKVLQTYNQTHLYVCGTGAFHPICAYLDIGKHLEQSIQRSGISVVIWWERGENRTDLAITTFVISTVFRLADGFNAISFLFPISEYHMISETRSSTNDFGGHRSLVNKWTTFLKARLICSVPGSNGIDTHFDELQDVFLMSSKDPKNPLIYAVFTTSSNIFKGSAVCMYSMSDVRRVFLGPYAHRDGPNYQWVPFQGRVPYPRPGTCPSKTFGGFDSTKDLPDDVITFARSHPAMYNPVHPISHRPIIIKTDVDYQFTQIVVDRVDAEDGQYDVLFIGTDVGTVLKVVSIPKETWRDLEEVLLEEMTVFREPIAITAMDISTKQLYLGSAIGVSQMPLHRCDVYGKACAECCLARDPYCAWDGTECSRYFPTSKRRTRRQDIRNGDPVTQCSDLQHHDELNGKGNLEEKIIYGVENSSTFLECSPKSQRALVYWQFHKQNEDRKDEIKADDRFIRTEQGLLIRSLQRQYSGIYYCQTVEHGFTQTLIKVTLEVIDTEHLEELLHKDEDGEAAKPKEGHVIIPPNQKVWYRDFMSLINHPNLNTMDEFCEQVWKRDRKQRKQRPSNAQVNANKWKHIQENKKGRNRRTHELERSPRSV